MYCYSLLRCIFLLLCIMIFGCGNDTQQSKRLVLAEIDSDGDNIVDETVRYIYDDSLTDWSGEETVIFIETGTSYGCPVDLSVLFYYSFTVSEIYCSLNHDLDDWTKPISLPFQYIYSSSESYIVEYEDLLFESLSDEDQISGDNIPQKVEYIYQYDNNGNVKELEHIKYFENNFIQTLSAEFTWE